MNDMDDEEQQIPGKKSPFRVLRKKDGKTYVELDARLIRTEEVHEQGGWLYDFRKWVENHNIHYYVFGTLAIILAYEAAEHYAPIYAPLVTGLMIWAVITAAAGAYGAALKEDRNHREWVHLIRFEAQEIDLGPDLDDLNLSRKTLQVKVTSDELFEIRDYMKTAESKYKIEFINDQVFEGLSKIHEVTSVDDATSRIFIGERDGIPSGLIFKMGMPSVDYVSKQMEKLNKEAKANGNNADDLQKFAKMHKAWTKQWDYMQKFMRKKGLTAFSMDDAPKWAKDYFFALEKESLPYWKKDNKTGETGLGYWHALSPEFRIPILLRIQKDYNQIRGEKVQLITTRQSDKMEAQSKSVVDIMTMIGMTQEAFEKMLIQRELSVTNLEDRGIKEAKEEIGVGRTEE